MSVQISYTYVFKTILHMFPLRFLLLWPMHKRYRLSILILTQALIHQFPEIVSTFQIKRTEVLLSLPLIKGFVVLVLMLIHHQFPSSGNQGQKDFLIPLWL